MKMLKMFVLLALALSMVFSASALVAKKVSISIAPYYPQGRSYVFECNANFAATNYAWYFGDGQKLINVTNQDVYHTYSEPGTYLVGCAAWNNNNRGVAWMTVTVK